MKKTINKHKLKLKKVTIWLFATVLIYSMFQSVSLLQKWELEFLDTWFQWRGERMAPEDVVLVLIDEETAKEYGGWPLPRKAYADLIHALNALHAGTIVFDLAFYDLRDSTDAQFLADATQQSMNVIHAYELVVHQEPTDNIDSTDMPSDAFNKFTLSTKKIGQLDIYKADSGTLPHEFFSQAFQYAGSTTLVQDADGHFRRIPLLLELSNNYYPALGFKTLLKHFDVPDSTISSYEEYSGHYVQFESRYESFRFPINIKAQVLLNFYGDLRWFENYSFVDVIRSVNAVHEGIIPGLARENFTNKIVIVALDLAGMDTHPIPFSASFPGVGFHATMVSNALEDSFLTEASNTVTIGIVVLFNLILYGVLYYWKPKNIVLSSVLFVLFVIFLNGILYMAFAFNDVWFKSLQITSVSIIPLFCMIVADRYLIKEKDTIIASYKTLRLLENEAKRKGFIIVGKNDESDFIPLYPREMTFLYYLTISKKQEFEQTAIKRKSYSDDERDEKVRHIIDPRGKKRGYFINKRDVFFECAKFCNYLDYIDEIGSYKKKQQGETIWKLKLSSQAIDNPRYIIDCRARINPKAKIYGNELISDANNKPP